MDEIKFQDIYEAYGLFTATETSMIQRMISDLKLEEMVYEDCHYNVDKFNEEKEKYQTTLRKVKASSEEVKEKLTKLNMFYQNMSFKNTIVDIKNTIVDIKNKEDELKTEAGNLQKKIEEKVYNEIYNKLLNREKKRRKKLEKDVENRTIHFLKYYSLYTDYYKNGLSIEE